MELKLPYALLFLFSVFVSSCSQILLKKSTEIEYCSKIQEYLNLKVVAAYFIFFISSFITVFAYKYIPLSLGPIFEASGYIFVAVLSWFFLHERIGKRKALGLLIILSGIVISNI